MEAMVSFSENNMAEGTFDYVGWITFGRMTPVIEILDFVESSPGNLDCCRIVCNSGYGITREFIEVRA